LRHLFAQGCGIRAGRFSGQLFIGEGRHFDMDVDAVEERPEYSLYDVKNATSLK
jgi:hypothetical protein